MQITRRSIMLGAAGAATVGWTLARQPATAQPATPTAAASSGIDPATGTWRFTDDKGVTVTLDAPPERLIVDVNAAAPLWDFGIRPVAVFGWNVNGDHTFTDAAGAITPDDVRIVGDATERFRIEDALALDPDLLITITWAPDDPNDYWSIDGDILDQVKQAFPIIALSATNPADAAVQRFGELAAALGADLNSAAISVARSAYEAKVDEARQIFADQQDLVVEFIYASPEEMYLANPPVWGDLAFYQSLGLNIRPVTISDNPFWQQLSLEDWSSFPCDVLFQSTRPGNLTIDQIETGTVSRLHPAAAAKQVFPWNQDFILSYQGMTAALEQILVGLRASRKVT